jgi:hypothetical protein
MTNLNCSRLGRVVGLIGFDDVLGGVAMVVGLPEGAVGSGDGFAVLDGPADRSGGASGWGQG